MHSKHFMTNYNNRLNGKFVYSHLNCNERGYTDKYGTYLADRFDPVKIECVDGELIFDKY